MDSPECRDQGSFLSTQFELNSNFNNNNLILCHGNRFENFEAHQGLPLPSGPASIEHSLQLTPCGSITFSNRWLVFSVIIPTRSSYIFCGTVVCLNRFGRFCSPKMLGDVSLQLWILFGGYAEICQLHLVIPLYPHVGITSFDRPSMSYGRTTQLAFIVPSISWITPMPQLQEVLKLCMNSCSLDELSSNQYFLSI